MLKQGNNSQRPHIF